MTHSPGHLESATHQQVAKFERVFYGWLSLVCALPAPLLLLNLWVKEQNQFEPGLFDFPVEFFLLLYASPIISLLGLALGVRSYWLQAKITGIGLWGLAANFALFVLACAVWLRLSML